MPNISVETRIRRNNYKLTNGDFSEGVQEYLNNLESAKEDIRKTWWGARYAFQVSDKMITAINTEIDREISYCKFYLEHQTRKQNEQLNKWIFIKKEDIDFGWREKIGEQWVKTNGKVKAIIQFNRTKKMVGLEVWFTNDNKHLKFFSYYDRDKLSKKSHLKSVTSISKRVEEYKTYADQVLNDCQYPIWNHEKQQFDLLKKLLDIESKVL